MDLCFIKENSKSFGSRVRNMLLNSNFQFESCGNMCNDVIKRFDESILNDRFVISTVDTRYQSKSNSNFSSVYNFAYCQDECILVLMHSGALFYSNLYDLDRYYLSRNGLYHRKQEIDKVENIYCYIDKYNSIISYVLENLNSDNENAILLLIIVILVCNCEIIETKRQIGNIYREYQSIGLLLLFSKNPNSLILISFYLIYYEVDKNIEKRIKNQEPLRNILLNIKYTEDLTQSV